MPTQAQAQINCPKCGTPVDVNKVLYDKVQAEIGQQYERTMEQEREKLATEQKKLADQMRQLDDQVKTTVEQQLAKAKKEQEESIRKSIASEHEEGVKALQKELEQKSVQVRELNQTKALLAQAQREKDELADKINAEAQAKLNETLKQEKAKIAKAEADKQELVVKEKDELIKSLSAQMEEMKRRAEQGSMQSQGEVQELAIEEWLRNAFPLDEVEEISKGVRGGDCIHRVRDRSGHELGAIYYESKRTKHFQAPWIAKLKQDMQAAKTHIGVIVTEAMPDGMDRMGQREGLWICTYDEFKSLCYVLREMILQVGTAVAAQENKGDKMAMLYNYLTGSEFAMHIEAIVGSFRKLKGDIASERRAYERIWNEREKNLDLVISNTAQM
ncbi:MAG: DUF2130 domain-containing protein [Flavobacteriales bacterium]|nr:DUF2130 domain-containing protein [Flavobacteriales bacterium]